MTKRAAAFLLLSMLAAGVLAVEIQFIVLRPRPHAELIHLGISFPSFPSGHAAIAFAGATFLALLAPQRTLLFFSVATMIAASRVALGVHHPSDVVLGAILGAATGAIAHGAFYSDRSDARPRWASWLWPQLAVVLFAAAGAYLGLTKFDFLQLPYADKTLHFVLFGLLTFFLLAWLIPSDVGRPVSDLVSKVRYEHR
jgi:hypothetical protein